MHSNWNEIQFKNRFAETTEKLKTKSHIYESTICWGVIWNITQHLLVNTGLASKKILRRQAKMNLNVL